MIIARLLYKLTASLPCRLINTPDGPYLERYYLGALLGRTFYLHRFVSGDSERHLHNHPWDAWAVVLCGAYDEEVAVDLCPAAPNGVLSTHRRVRWFNRIPSNKFHRIHRPARGTWTLLVHGPRVRRPDGGLKGWGVLTEKPLPMGDCARYCTVFTPVDSEPPRHAAWPLGRDAGRAPL